MSEMNIETEGRFLSEDFGLSSPMETEAQARTADTVALEIRTLKRQAQGIVLGYAIEIGRRLTEAKAMVPHGEWGAWLKREVEYSQSTAQNLMLLYREYGDEQQSLFGTAPKSQTFGNLTYSKALRLLAISDEEERERFVAENDVEHMTTRELNEALKARDAALEEAAAAIEDAKDIRREVNQLREQMADQTRVYEAKLTSANEEADRAQSMAQRLQDALSEANTSVQAAEAEHNRLVRELEELRNSAGANTEIVEAARKAAIEEMSEKVNKAKDAKKQAEEKRKAAEEALASAKKELAELKAKGPEIRELTQEEKDKLTADAVEKAKAEAAEQLRSMEKKLTAADPDVTEFKVLFAAWQYDYYKMAEVLKRIAEADEEKASKLRLAVQAALEKMTLEFEAGRHTP